MRHIRGPKEVEASEELRRRPAGASVLVYRTKSKSWEGPHTFVSIDVETEVVQTKSGRKIHLSTCVRPSVLSTFPPQMVGDIDVQRILNQWYTDTSQEVEEEVRTDERIYTTRGSRPPQKHAKGSEPFLGI